MVTKNCEKPLKSNPFQVYRDPNTGKWVVIKPCQQQIKKNSLI
ncbi:MAG: hypothetical protein QNJ68_04165 [Microcoleaceae cyanobacterium MO_207.B10]|nr:hypothetical protein [Microcoleaceae cyanobacterium MO_207.B10]